MADIFNSNNNNNLLSSDINTKKKRKRKRKNVTDNDHEERHEGITSLKLFSRDESYTDSKMNRKIKFGESENCSEKSSNSRNDDPGSIPKVEQIINPSEESNQDISVVSKNHIQQADNLIRKFRGDVKRTVNKSRDETKNVTFFLDDEDELNANKSRKTDKKSLKERAASLLKVRETLPVYKNRYKIMDHIAANKVVVLIGETGSGKSTQIPQFLMSNNKKSIAVTQPRRVAAINLASRVAEENGTVLGDRVGYSVRFDSKSNKSTKLKYLTDGMLLRELMMDSDLSRYSTIIIDEAHERTILTDLLMGFLKQLLKKRKHDNDFKVIIMSATLDAEKFSKFFDNCEILYVEGKMYPVERLYLSQKTDDIIDTTIKTIVQVNQSEIDGGILVFLPGQEEIDKVCSSLQTIAPLLPKECPMIIPFPLYAALPPVEQLKVFDNVKKSQRKVILATNIAETSITIPGMRYVIDSGLRKVKVWRHQLNLSTLLTVPISQASAIQRAGRAGRERSGKTFRLYLENDYVKLPKQTEPEIIRTDIAHSILMLKKLGVQDVVNWYWLEHPGQDSLFAALHQLYSLKALDDNGNITNLGEQMSILPLPPHLSTVLISSFESNCLQWAIDIISCLSVENLILNPPSDKRDEINEKRRQMCVLGNRYGDLLMFKEFLDYFMELNSNADKKSWCKEFFLNFRAFKNVMQIRQQLAAYMKSLFGENILNESNLSDDNDQYFDDAAENVITDGSGMRASKYAAGYNNQTLLIETLLKCFLRGFVGNSAIGYPDRSYRTVFTGQLISIHPSSLLFGKKCNGIMYTEFVYTSKGYARNVSIVNPEWLKDIAPHVLGNRESIEDSSLDRL